MSERSSRRWRARQFQGSRCDNRRHVVPRSRGRRIRSEYHARCSGAALRNPIGRLSGPALSGYVTKIVPTADRAKATVLVKIKFKDYDDRVLPEMGAKITFLAPGSDQSGAQAKSLLTVPAAAVASRNGRQVVFQVKDERAAEIPVALGGRMGNLMEIKEGLNEGDRVIGKVDENIRAGSKISIKSKCTRSPWKQALIEVQNLSKSYRRDSLEIPVLRNISLNVTEGEFIAFMGPSGSGKTTLLNLIAGIDRPSEGRILIAGVDVTELTETELAAWRSRNVGFIFQFYNLIPVLTAVENVELPLILTPLSKKQRRAHAETALEVVGLADRMHHYPRQLSGGQEQRVAIARAIATDPAILVADEPTGDLDKVSAEEVLDLMDRLNRELNKTILMVTHDPRAAERARSVRHLEKGELANGSSFDCFCATPCVTSSKLADGFSE